MFLEDAGQILALSTDLVDHGHLGTFHLHVVIPNAERVGHNMPPLPCLPQPRHPTNVVPHRLVNLGLAHTPDASFGRSVALLPQDARRAA